MPNNLQAFLNKCACKYISGCLRLATSAVAALHAGVDVGFQAGVLGFDAT
jgi:hypothetical protein